MKKVSSSNNNIEQIPVMQASILTVLKTSANLNNHSTSNIKFISKLTKAIDNQINKNSNANNNANNKSPDVKAKMYFSNYVGKILTNYQLKEGTYFR